jgi:hypothetical protein
VQKIVGFSQWLSFLGAVDCGFQPMVIILALGAVDCGFQPMVIILALGAVDCGFQPMVIILRCSRLWVSANGHHS